MSWVVGGCTPCCAARLLGFSQGIAGLPTPNSVPPHRDQGACAPSLGRVAQFLAGVLLQDLPSSNTP